MIHALIITLLVWGALYLTKDVKVYVNYNQDKRRW